jgi:hypothetical protein
VLAATSRPDLVDPSLLRRAATPAGDRLTDQELAEAARWLAPGVQKKSEA